MLRINHYSYICDFFTYSRIRDEAVSYKARNRLVLDEGTTSVRYSSVAGNWVHSVARYSPHAQPVPSFAAAAAKLAIAASFYDKRINYNY
jgi:hypothetical protein